MAFKYFNVKNGLSAGNIILDATTGNVDVTNLSVADLTSLGNVGNITITGGNPGEVLTTDGSGNLTFAPAGGTANAFVVSPMPYYIAPAETYYVINDRQGLFSLPITIDGSLEVDGVLVQVDGTNVTPSSGASFASPLSWDSNDSVFYSAYAQANNLTINAGPTSVLDGTQVRFRLKDNGTARTLTWTQNVSGGFRAIGVTLPTATVPNKTVYVTCVYNSHDSRWDAINVSQEN